MQEIECIISGRVQMVMYRDFAERKARKLGVVGTVQNLSNGTVRVIAQADEKTLDRYIGYLRKGPLLAHVEGVKIEKREPAQTFSDFSIMY